MTHQYKYLTALSLMVCGSTTAIAQTEIQLGDPGVTTTAGSGERFTAGAPEVEMSIRGEINWADDIDRITRWDSDWYTSPVPTPVLPTDNSGAPLDFEPYGDVLAYAGSGLGDVDDDGYGDFGLTWYNGDTQLAFTEANMNSCRVHFNHEAEYVGFVRIMSGKPDYSGPGQLDDTNTNNADQRKSTFNQPSVATYDSNTRRIGDNFWGHRANSLWSHEINAIGDIDGDGRDDVLLSANGKVNSADPFADGVGYDGLVEIWAFTSQYNLNNDPTERWVKLIEIKGAISTGDQRALEFGYQSHHGPVPKNPTYSPDPSDGFDLDFNNDGQQDLLLASKFYRDTANGDYMGSGGRKYAPGAAWIFLLPTKDVFQNIKTRINQDSPDDFCNSTALPIMMGSDGITDDLPLKYSEDDYSVRITGHQGYKTDDGTPPLYAPQFYGRHFGYDIDPAGDVDGDGNLDLVVSAPHHFRNHNTSDGLFKTNLNDPFNSGEVDGNDNPIAVKHEGAVYLFLSNSGINRDASGLAFSDLLPKYYLGPNIQPQVNPSAVIGAGPIIIRETVKTRPMADNQIGFTSEHADFVFAGDSADGYSSETAAVGSSIEAGIDLNGNDDPDFVIHNRRRSRAHVIPDLYSRLSYTFGTDDNGVINRPLAMTEIWDSEVGEADGVYSIPLSINNIQHIDDENAFAISRSTIAYFSTTYQQIGITSAYAAIGGFRIAGNHDGDIQGDHELFLVTNSNTRGFCKQDSNCTPLDNTNTKGIIVVDINTITPDISILTSYIPEHANLCTQKFDTKFNKNGIHINTDNLNAWPIWSGIAEDGKDDAFIGIRGFPRQAHRYPSYDPGLYDPAGAHPNTHEDPPTWNDIAYPPHSDCDKNTMSVVPAGKAYVVRTP